MPIAKLPGQLTFCTLMPKVPESPLVPGHTMHCLLCVQPTRARGGGGHSNLSFQSRLDPSLAGVWPIRCHLASRKSVTIQPPCGPRKAIPLIDGDREGGPGGNKAAGWLEPPGGPLEASLPCVETLIYGIARNAPKTEISTEMHTSMGGGRQEAIPNTKKEGLRGQRSPKKQKQDIQQLSPPPKNIGILFGGGGAVSPTKTGSWVQVTENFRRFPNPRPIENSERGSHSNICEHELEKL